jgi:hypothetical protein
MSNSELEKARHILDVICAEGRATTHDLISIMLALAPDGYATIDYRANNIVFTAPLDKGVGHA